MALSLPKTVTRNLSVSISRAEHWDLDAYFSRRVLTLDGEAFGAAVPSAKGRCITHARF
jgi:hypothetical protein